MKEKRIHVKTNQTYFLSFTLRLGLQQFGDVKVPTYFELLSSYTHHIKTHHPCLSYLPKHSSHKVITFSCTSLYKSTTIEVLNPLTIATLHSTLSQGDSNTMELRATTPIPWSLPGLFSFWAHSEPMVDHRNSCALALSLALNFTYTSVSLSPVHPNTSHGGPGTYTMLEKNQTNHVTLTNL
jgi:hypothetical protein